MFPVADDGHVRGRVTTRHVKRVPRDQWATHTVSEIAAPWGANNTISPDADAVTALARMKQPDNSRL